MFYASATSLAKRVSNGEISCANLINEFYNRIKKHNNVLNAIVIDNKKEALETARKLDIDLKDGSIDRISVGAVFPKKKVGIRKSRDSAVKINSELLVEVEEFINLDKNKFKYVNRKQFIDIAVADYLRRQRGKK